MFKDYYNKYRLNEEKPSSERISAIKNAVLSEKEGKFMKNNNKKRFARKAVIIPIAAVLAVGAATASAASFGLFNRFSRFFEQTGSDASSLALSEEDIVKCEEFYETDNYNLTINGLYCDKYSLLVSYDVEYKADKYFENGKLKDYICSRNGTPVVIFPDVGSGSAGDLEFISGEGNTASFVYEITTPSGFYRGDSGEFDLVLNIQFDDVIFGEDESEDLTAARPSFRRKLRKTMPIANTANAHTDKKIQAGDKTLTLDSMTAGKLSVCFAFSEEFDESYHLYDVPFSLTLKDGTVIRNDPESALPAVVVKSDQAIVFCYNKVIDTNDITQIKYGDCIVDFENGAATKIW